jgi:hypothetical protein
VLTLTRPAPRYRALLKLAAARTDWVAAALFLLAAGLRLYHLGADPLWYDELISTLVVRAGPLAIFANSQTDQHPPLYYLLLWLTSGFGAAHAEWAWRWGSALAGALSVPVLFALARRSVGVGPAALAAGWLAFNPTAVYFSQEARWPALTLLLALLLTLVFTDLLAQPGERRRWVVYAALAAAGMFTSYSFVWVAAGQLPFVLWAVRRQPGAWRLALTLMGCLVLQLVLAANPLSAAAAQHVATAALHVRNVLQGLLAGDVFRYGVFWPHRYTLLLLGALAGLGSWHWLRTAPRPAWAYAPLQVAAPLAAYGLVLSPLLHLNLPGYETRQFLVLLPALYLLFAHGLAQLWAWLPRPAAWGVGLLLSAVVLAGSVQGLNRYWTITRSPEGQAVRFVAPQLAPGDALVALDFFSAAALNYYLPDQRLYLRPTLTGAGLHLVQVRGELGYGPRHRPPADIPLAEVQAHPRLWVFSVPGELDEHLPLILAGCQVEATTDIAWLPVRVQRVSHCAAAVAP